MRLNRATAYVDPAHPAIAGLGAHELPSWLQRCSEAALDEVFKDEQRDRVGRVEMDGVQWVFKSQRRHGMEAWRRRLGGGPLWREWRQSRRLAAAGICVSSPVALIEKNDSDGRQQILLLPFVGGVSLCHLLMGFELPAQWRGLSNRQRRRVARMVGDQVGAIVSAGLVNRDHKPANLILTHACLAATQGSSRPAASPVVIDPVGLRRRTRRRTLRMLAVLCRTSLRAGPTTSAEMLTCLSAAARRDPTLAPAGTRQAQRTALRALARAIARSAGVTPSSQTRPYTRPTPL